MYKLFGISIVSGIPYSTNHHCGFGCYVPSRYLYSGLVIVWRRTAYCINWSGMLLDTCFLGRWYTLRSSISFSNILKICQAPISSQVTSFLLANVMCSYYPLTLVLALSSLSCSVSRQLSVDICSDVADLASTTSTTDKRTRSKPKRRNFEQRWS